ncbi:MAG TPA: triple tyrosine motif-containing protein, partial [Verrucomicrobiae bacterium]|nr:triple tyrosine motif-containing protein [Verrucomicrobiae bacterium]
IGYAGWGLGRFKDGHFSKITSERGLYDDYISQIVSDGKGWLWFGADHGIFKVREQELNRAMENPSVRVQSVHYGRSEDLPSLQANFDESPNSWRSRDGRLWLPMSTALAVVDPDKFHEDSEPPPVLLNRILLDDALIASYGDVMPVSTGIDLKNSQATLRLPPGHHRLEFDFTALSFSAPENVVFQYRLAGFDNRWIEAGTQRSAIYSRLAAGNYRFEVRGCNSDGVWNKTNAALSFSVAPFFWQTWWFRFATTGLFTLIVIAVVRYVSFRRLQSRIRMLEQQAALDKERARIARDIHDHLGGTLTQMTLQLELALRNGEKPEKAAGHVQQSLATARQAIQSLDETVWAVNPGNDTLPHLVNYIGEYAVGFLDSAGIRCRADLPEFLPAQSVSAETRHNLFLAVKEALNNVVRHASASEVRLRASVNNGSLQFTVEDNGHGFQPATNKNFAEGLHNMRQRMEEIGGQFEIESNAGAGTRISFVCPWRNEN